MLGIPTYGRTYKLDDPADTTLGSYADGPGEGGPITGEKGWYAYFEVSSLSNHFYIVCFCLTMARLTTSTPVPGPSSHHQPYIIPRLRPRKGLWNFQSSWLLVEYSRINICTNPSSPYVPILTSPSFTHSPKPKSLLISQTLPSIPPSWINNFCIKVYNVIIVELN